MSSATEDGRCEISTTPPVATLTNRIVSLRNWWSKASDDESKFVLLLDLRQSNLYEKRLLGHSRLRVVPFPAQYLKERSFELPARHVEFSILVEKSELEQVQTFLLEPKSPARKRPGKAWKVTDILVDEPALWEQAMELEISSEGKVDTFPLQRLWQPDPMVENVLLKCLQNCTSNGSLQVWDLASGAGRDVAFLAEELLAAGNPYEVWGFDHRYNAKETKITGSFWERRGVSHLTKCVKLDLSAWDAVISVLPTNPVAAIFCVRFWKIDLVTAIAKCTELTPGTLFGLSHFCKPHKGALWNFDHPSEKTVLERNQLNDLFHEQGWEIMHDEIALDSDHGRTMIQFVCRKS
jgi:hypothetical protein